jgi:histidinol-phosphate phosphatase family protein
MNQLEKINNNRTLFLDRDGVINHQKEGGYILQWQEFVFYEGVLEAMPILAAHFHYIFIVTNQRGVGKGLMSENELHHIHHHMKRNIEQAGGRIDGIYYCPATTPESPCRKPNTGMALQAKKDFPAVDFNMATMVGNSISDMEFGKGIGANTVFLTTTQPTVDPADTRIDAVYKSLAAFAASLTGLR